MQKEYKVEVNGNSEFTLTEKLISGLDIQLNDGGKSHLIDKNNSYRINIEKDDFLKKSYIININGNSYSIDILDELDQFIKEMGFEVVANKVINVINAPMPGLILKVNVNEGDKIIENDSLIILEAMKMENVISSPRDGIIKKINVTKGEAIDKGHLLIEFE